jgi:hypothetical protein
VKTVDPETGEAIKVRKPNKGLSKYRRGFPVKLSKDNILMLHITYLWMQKHNETTPDLDAFMLTLPPHEAAKQRGWREKVRKKTYRIRGHEVVTLRKLLERAHSLPFTSCGVFWRIMVDLTALNPMDLMVDAQRE